jgi:hypothetical protein
MVLFIFIDKKNKGKQMPAAVLPACTCRKNNLSMIGEKLKVPLFELDTCRKKLAGMVLSHYFSICKKARNPCSH